MQLDLFGDPPIDKPSLIGLTVTLPDECPRCGEYIAAIGAGCGPHRAALLCSKCRRHRGWMSETSFDFVAESVRQFGRPVDPISVNRNLKE
jgi:hypothetical protein